MIEGLIASVVVLVSVVVVGWRVLILCAAGKEIKRLRKCQVGDAIDRLRPSHDSLENACVYQVGLMAKMGANAYVTEAMPPSVSGVVCDALRRATYDQT